MITAPNLIAMFDYWFNTPCNSIFGQGFGADRTELFLKPEDTPIADNFLNKLKRDLPIFADLSSEQLSVEVEKDGFDVVMIYVRLGNILIELGKPADSIGALSRTPTGETFDANAQ